MRAWVIAVVFTLAAMVLFGTYTNVRTADAANIVVPDIATVGRTGRPDLIENSAAVMSLTQPGVFFTINDSGNEPILYAMDTAGTDRGAWRVTGATNIDWESASIGPCMAPPREQLQTIPSYCIYIGDTGDNWARYSKRVIYRVPEPTAEGAGSFARLSPRRNSSIPIVRVRVTWKPYTWGPTLL